jgi:Protein of unknown function (DUF3107)
MREGVGRRLPTPHGAVRFRFRRERIGSARAATLRRKPHRVAGHRRPDDSALLFEREDRKPMEIKLGVIYSPKELEIETEQSADEVAKAVEDALSGGEQVLWLLESTGRRIGIPVDKLAYIEIGEENATKRVGFTSR